MRLLMLLLLLGAGSAAAEELELRSIKIGDHRDTVAPKHPDLEMRCGKDLEGRVRKICFFAERSWSGNRRKDYEDRLDFSAFYNEEGLVEMVWKPFPSVDYSKLRDALEQKFGAPTSTDTQTLRNGYGAEFERMTWSWVRGNALLTINSIDDKPTKGMIRLERVLTEEEAAQERQAQAESAKDEI